MTVTVRKWGNSLAVRIPKAVATDGRLREGLPVQVRLRGGEVVLTPLPSRPTLKRLLAGVNKRNRHGEVDTGGPVGGEIW